MGFLAWASGSQATQIAWFPSKKRHQGCSWALQMGLFCLSERCVSWSQLRPLIPLALPFHLTMGSSITPLPLLLGHPRLEVMCAKAWHVNGFPGSALLVGSSLSGKLPTGHRCLGGFREMLGALRDVSHTVYGVLEVLGPCCPGF